MLISSLCYLLSLLLHCFVVDLAALQFVGPIDHVKQRAELMSIHVAVTA